MSSGKILVSVIVPTYNRKNYLEQTIQSILEQSINDLEVIIINDGSTDGTDEFLNNLTDPRIVHVNRSRSGNISFNRNFGMKIAKGEYIAFCDDDDIWFKDRLKIGLKYIEDYEFVCSNFEVVDTNLKAIRKNIFMDMNKNTELMPDILLKRNYVLTSSVLFKKEIFLDGLIFNENRYANLAEDYDFSLRISFLTPILFIAENLGLYRQHLSISNEVSNRIKLTQNEFSIVNEYSKYNDPKIRISARIGAVSFLMELYHLYLQDNNFKKAIYQLFRILSRMTNKEVFIYAMKKMFRVK